MSSIHQALESSEANEFSKWLEVQPCVNMSSLSFLFKIVLWRHTLFIAALHRHFFQESSAQTIFCENMMFMDFELFFIMKKLLYNTRVRF